MYCVGKRIQVTHWEIQLFQFDYIKKGIGWSDSLTKCSPLINKWQMSNLHISNYYKYSLCAHLSRKIKHLKEWKVLLMSWQRDLITKHSRDQI